MKAWLEFSLPEEAEEHRHAVQGGHYFSLLRQIDEHLRQRLKYCDPPPDVREELEQVRGLIRENVDLDA